MRLSIHTYEKHKPLVISSLFPLFKATESMGLPTNNATLMDGLGRQHVTVSDGMADDMAETKIDQKIVQPFAFHLICVPHSP